VADVPASVTRWFADPVNRMVFGVCEAKRYLLSYSSSYVSSIEQIRAVTISTQLWDILVVRTCT